VQANLLAATAENPAATNQVYNVAVGERTNLNALHQLIRSELIRLMPSLDIAPPEYRDFRAGDVRHSLADIGKASSLLGYQPSHTIAQGMRDAMAWYVQDLARN
jgi:UDP-N-acetylglucosamine 4-epimerase